MNRFIKTHANCAYCLIREKPELSECLRLYHKNFIVNLPNVNHRGCKDWKANNEIQKLINSEDK